MASRVTASRKFNRAGPPKGGPGRKAPPGNGVRTKKGVGTKVTGTANATANAMTWGKGRKVGLTARAAGLTQATTETAAKKTSKYGSFSTTSLKRTGAGGQRPLKRKGF